MIWGRGQGWGGEGHRMRKWAYKVQLLETVLLRRTAQVVRCRSNQSLPTGWQLFSEVFCIPSFKTYNF